MPKTQIIETSQQPTLFGRRVLYDELMTTLADAKKLQIERKLEARALLDKFQFEALFNRYGRYEIRGSFAHNLMLKPDLDGTIYVPELQVQRVLKLVGELVQTTGVQSVTVENRAVIDDPLETNRLGWVIRAKLPFGGQKWNLDIHILKPEDAAGHDYLGEHKYNAEQHDAMLFIKAQLTEQGLYPGSSKVPGSFASVDVYRAVIEDGIRTTEGLINWGRSHEYYGK